MSDGCPASLGFLMLCPPLGDSLLSLPVGPSWRDGSVASLGHGAGGCYVLPQLRCVSPLPAPSCCALLSVLPLPKQSLPFRQTTSQAETCHPGRALYHFPGHVPATALGAPGPGGMPCRAIFQHEKKNELDLLRAPFSQPKCLKV